MTSKLVAACLALAALSACTVYNPPPVAPAAVAVQPAPGAAYAYPGYAYPAYPGYAYPAYPGYAYAYPGYAYAPAIASLNFGFGFGGHHRRW
jgi:hypothetical protein